MLHLLLIRLIARDRAQAAPPVPVQASSMAGVFHASGDPRAGPETHGSGRGAADEPAPGAQAAASGSSGAGGAGGGGEGAPGNAGGAQSESLHARLLAFLRVDEFLVDIGDDLTDYEVRYGPCMHACCAVLAGASACHA